MIPGVKRILRALYMLFYVPYCRFSKKSTVRYSTILNLRTKLSSGCAIGAGSNICSSEIGYGSYMGEDNMLCNVSIGKYCCLADNIKVIAATHPTSRFVSFHPAFYSTRKQAGFSYTATQRFDEYRFVDGKFFCKIGNDVWIGEDVKILGGVTIGDGALIAAGAVVIKDVPPYTIVGGVPAKVIRSRFEPHQVEFLLKFQWWNKSERWIKSNIEEFQDITRFYSAYHEDSTR